MDFRVSYKSFGLPMGSAPVVLVNHSLTGNADVTGENGWWSELIGDGKVIDTQKYTILAFNFPGNGADNDVIENYNHLVLRDVANLYNIPNIVAWILAQQSRNITDVSFS